MVVPRLESHSLTRIANLLLTEILHG